MTDDGRKLITDKDRTLIIETSVKLSGLIDRIDNHRKDDKAVQAEMNKKLDSLMLLRTTDREDLKKEISAVRLKSVKENNKLGLKIAALTAIFGTLSGGIGSYIIKYLLKG
jgi:hypothetical protein